MFKRMLQEAIVLLFRPLIVREVWGWGKVYEIFIGGHKRNWLWKNAKKRTIRGKLNYLLMELDISQWTDRSTFFIGRWYDFPTQEILKQVLMKGDEVADVGANVGMFSLTARHYIGSEGTVYAFEPNPIPRAQLNRNIEINQIENILVYPVGLGETNGQFSLYVPNINSGEGSLAPVNYDNSEWYATQVEIRVGDDLLQQAALRLIKIDVEGAEVSVFKGITRLIDKHRPLIIAEYVPDHLNRFGNRIEEILSFAQLHSYKVFQMGETKTAAGYELSLIPVEGTEVEAGDILLGHQEDPYITSVQDHMTNRG